MQNPEALTRLKIVEGHIRGIERMIEDGAYCIDIIRQIQAVQSALSKINSQVLDSHLKSCLTTAVRGNDLAERERVLGEVAEIFETASKI
jgi:CsoR family transcriptional regulator, copper-sensing transcriptional repressor